MAAVDRNPRIECFCQSVAFTISARVAPLVRRQLINRGPERLVLLAIGGDGEHRGRDGHSWADWEEAGDGRPPQEVPLPEDLPEVGGG